MVIMISSLISLPNSQGAKVQNEKIETGYGSNWWMRKAVPEFWFVAAVETGEEDPNNWLPSPPHSRTPLLR